MLIACLHRLLWLEIVMTAQDDQWRTTPKCRHITVNACNFLVIAHLKIQQLFILSTLQKEQEIICAKILFNTNIFFLNLFFNKRMSSTYIVSTCKGFSLRRTRTYPFFGSQWLVNTKHTRRRRKKYRIDWKVEKMAGLSLFFYLGVGRYNY